MPAEKQDGMAGTGLGEGMLLKRVFKKHAFFFEPPEPAGKPGAITVHDFAREHVHRNHDDQIRPLRWRLGG